MANAFWITSEIILNVAKRTEKYLGGTTMLLKELAKEYRESAVMIIDRINEIKKQNDISEICEMDKLRLRRRLDFLQNMYYDTVKTAKYLESYYDEVEK